MRPSLLVFSLIPLAILAGCGTKGPLILTPGPDKPPLFGRSAPAPVTAMPTTPSKPTTARDDSNKPAAGAGNP